MATESITLIATPRAERGKGAARKLRGTGRVPAVVYGRQEETRALSVDAHELTLLFNRISVENTIIELSVEGEDAPVNTLVREVQAHPYRNEILHVDFYQVRAGEEIEVGVPIRLEGTPIGVREDGGVLDHVIHDLTVRCVPSKIPNVIELDVSEMVIGDALHVSDINLPEGVTTLIDLERTICSVAAPRAEEEPEVEEGEEEELLEGEEGAGEPEVIGKGGEEADGGGEEESAE
ncbi:MAG: 50S ribosomal protein L25/general stress protein Ctc [Gemmatimonadota bacterium]